MDSRALLAFVAADRRLALPLEDVRRVIPLPLVQAPVGAPAFIEGIFDYRGTPVAAVRVDRLMGLGEERLGVYSPLLLLKGVEPLVALHVSRVTSIIKLGSSDVQPVGSDETFNACVVGRVSDGGESVYVLSTENILIAEERAKIATHLRTKKQRLDRLAGDEAGALAHAG